MALHPYPVHSQKDHEIHRAGFIIIDSDTVIEDGFIEIENHQIKNIFKGRPKQKYRDHGPGVLFPAFVNAHVHLELSALSGRVPFKNGFKPWVQALLKKRAALSENKLITAAKDAAIILMKTGHQTIADISTLGIGKTIFKDLNINGVSFHEYLGETLRHCDLQKQKNFAFSLAGHAPHSTSPELLKALKQKTRQQNLPFSIHVAESDDETQFIRHQTGDWADFLMERGIEFDSWNIRRKTPVAHIYDLGILGPSTLAVHLLNVTQKDLDQISDTKTKVVLCPRSNYNLHGKLPNIDAMLQRNIQPALGSDSLASCSSLSILDEMRFIRKNYPQISAPIIFSMGTLNGAKALGLDTITGSLAKGKQANMVYCAINKTTKKNLLERIISNE